MRSTSWWRELTGGERLALAGWAGAVLLGLSGLDTPHLCPFHALTGWRCPGCGMGHAVQAAFRGDWAGSWAAHPLGLPLAALWTAWVLRGALNTVRGRRFGDGAALAPNGAAAWACLAGVLAVHFLRV